MGVYSEREMREKREVREVRVTRHNPSSQVATLASKESTDNGEETEAISIRSRMESQLSSRTRRGRTNVRSFTYEDWIIPRMGRYETRRKDVHITVSAMSIHAGQRKRTPPEGAVTSFQHWFKRAMETHSNGLYGTTH